MPIRLTSLLFILLILVFFALLLGVFSREVPAAIVKGRSMLPLLREGDIVFIIRCKPDEIKVGDIIVYKSKIEGKLIIHRVINILYSNGEYYYITKGDNNAIMDIGEFDRSLGINQKRVVGKVLSLDNYVFKIPYIGNLALMLRKS
jgi:signal peptidase